jgi:hypothetical protein
VGLGCTRGSGARAAVAAVLLQAPPPPRALAPTLLLAPPSALQVEDDPTGGKLAATSGKLGGAPHKLEPVSNFHIGDTITALQRAVMQPGGQEVGEAEEGREGGGAGQCCRGHFSACCASAEHSPAVSLVAGEAAKRVW